MMGTVKRIATVAGVATACVGVIGVGALAVSGALAGSFSQGCKNINETIAGIFGRR